MGIFSVLGKDWVVGDGVVQEVRKNRGFEGQQKGGMLKVSFDFIEESVTYCLPKFDLPS